MNEAFCLPHTTKLRRLRRCAKKQGQGLLFRDIKKDEQRVQALLSKYDNEIGDVESFRLPEFDFAQFEMFERTEKQVRRRRVGSMMTEDRWVSFAQTPDGGRLTPMSAKRQWDKWHANPKHPRDTKGRSDSSHKVLQLYVHTDVQLIHDDVYSKGKQATKSRKPIKNPSEGDLAQMHRNLFMGGGDDSDVHYAFMT